MGVPRRRARRVPTPKAGQPTLCLVKQRWVRVSGRDRHPLFVKAETLVRTNGFCSHRPEARRCPSKIPAPVLNRALLDATRSMSASYPIATGRDQPTFAAQNDSEWSVLLILVKEYYQIITASH